MKLIIASNNAHKLVEIKEILGGEFDEILSMREAGIEHETVEDGSTFMANAEKKAREIAEISGSCALADDSGLCVDALDGGAHYTCAMVLAQPDGSVVEAEGYLYGEIAREEAGSNGFGYDPLFYLPERGCTTAQISSEEKNAISHRANALHALLKKLRAE